MQSSFKKLIFLSFSTFSSELFYAFLITMVEIFSWRCTTSEGKDTARTRETESSLDKPVPHKKGTTPKLKILQKVLSTFPLHVNTIFLNDRRIASHPLQSPQTNKTQQQITGNVNIHPGWAAGTRYERYHLPSALVHTRIDLRSCILLACILTAQPGQVRFFTGWEASFCFSLSSRQNPSSSLRKSCRLIWRVRKENPTNQTNKKLWWILPFYYFILDVRNQYSAVNCIWWVTSNPIIHHWCFSWDFSKGSSSLAQTLGTVSAWHLNMVMCI